jgi:putative aldouronate transport system substrate-binding protein
MGEGVMKIRLSIKRKLSNFCVVCFVISLMLNTSVLAQNNDFTTLDSNEETESTVIQWYLLGDPPNDIDAVSEKANEYIRNKINAEIHFNFIGWGDFFEGKEKLYASGEKVDIIYAAGWWNYAKDVSKGYYYPLNGLLDEFAPKTKEILGENLLKGAEVQDKIYALAIPGQCNAAASGIRFRKDLVKKYNINLNKIKKIEDVEPILKLIKSKQPSIVPLFNKSNTLNYDILNMQSIGSDLNCPGCLSAGNKDMMVYNEFAKAETKAFLKTLNKFHKLGYIKKPKNNYDNMELNKAFAILDTSLNPIYDENNLYRETVNVYLAKPSITNSSATSSMNAISSNTENPELDLRLIELVNTDKYLNNLLHFGIEGEHYVKISKNVIKYSLNSSNADYPNSMYWMIGNRFLDFTFNFEDKNKYQSLKDFNDKAIAVKTLGFTFIPEPVSKEIAACASVWSIYVPNLLTGEYDPDKYIPIINKEFKKAGINKVMAETQKQYNKWIESQYIMQ